MSINDKVYFSRRALEERERAEVAPSKNIAEVHLSLATKYEILAEQSGQVAELNDDRVTSVPGPGNPAAPESPPQSTH